MQAPKVRAVDDGRGGHYLSFFCPGCQWKHQIQSGTGGGPRWGWNGSVEKPTFTPSVLVTTGHYAAGRRDDGCWCDYYEKHPEEPRDVVCGVCHSFVTDGRIQFLSDCTHSLAGQTVVLPVFPEES